MTASATAGDLIETRHLTRVLAGPVPVTLVEDVDVTVRPDELLAITGPSGSGKSSLLYLLGLLDRPTEGDVLVEGRDTAELDADALADIRLSRIGFVFQFHFLLPEFTALENVLMPMQRRGALTAADMRARALGLLDDLGLQGLADRKPHQLSGGQAQRAAIARALANDPPIVLADEPTGNLDTHSTEQVAEIFETLAHAGGRAVVMVTHDPTLAGRADRTIRIVDGRVVDGARPDGQANKKRKRR